MDYHQTLKYVHDLNESVHIHVSKFAKSHKFLQTFTMLQSL